MAIENHAMAALPLAGVQEGAPTVLSANATLHPAEPATLTIVIPALNEEESIGSTIQRCLDARERICRVGGIADIEIIVVSDGSTDNTAAIADEFARRDPRVRVIVFEKNR